MAAMRGNKDKTRATKAGARRVASQSTALKTTAAPTTPRHFLDLKDFDAATLRRLLDEAAAEKAGRFPGGVAKPMTGKTLALIFEKPSTRTRISFEVAMRTLGGEVTILGRDDSQLGRGETIADTARVLSRYVDGIMLRTLTEKSLIEMAQHASVPVINGLTDHSHPCQLMADILTFEEWLGPIKGRSVAWVGDGNNVCESWIHAAARFDFELRIAAPATLAPPAETMAWAKREGAHVTLTEDPAAAVRGVDCVVTDTWFSMGSGAPDAVAREEKLKLLSPYRVDEKLMGLARADAIFQHCLPACREREVSAGVIDGPRSAVWDEAENRLHAQKAIIRYCMG
ncbi:MAG TPA: ornithine carbamoyltransferase [Alphaproteobacteria bacterium]|jgi:ornithine carbamoyltransferase|nr:ornithine carbamoyltransferase [Alphaproteobacteria bacterium]